MVSNCSLRSILFMGKQSTTPGFGLWRDSNKAWHLSSWISDIKLWKPQLNILQFVSMYVVSASSSDLQVKWSLLLEDGEGDRDPVLLSINPVLSCSLCYLCGNLARGEGASVPVCCINVDNFQLWCTSTLTLTNRCKLSSGKPSSMSVSLCTPPGCSSNVMD